MFWTNEWKWALTQVAMCLHCCLSIFLLELFFVIFRRIFNDSVSEGRFITTDGIEEKIEKRWRTKMGLILAKYWRLLWSGKGESIFSEIGGKLTISEHKVILVGLDNAGKTTILYHLWVFEASFWQLIKVVPKNLRNYHHMNFLSWRVWYPAFYC